MDNDSLLQSVIRTGPIMKLLHIDSSISGQNSVTRGLTRKIMEAKENLSAIEGDIKAIEAIVGNLAKSIAESELPPGSLPEIQAEIAKVQAEHQAARDEMIREQERIAHQKREAEAEAKRQAAEIHLDHV